VQGKHALKQERPNPKSASGMGTRKSAKECFEIKRFLITVFYYKTNK